MRKVVWLIVAVPTVCAVFLLWIIAALLMVAAQALAIFIAAINPE